MSDLGHWCSRHSGVWVVPEEPCHLCIAEEVMRKERERPRIQVSHDFRITSRYMALGIRLSFCPEDEDGPSGAQFHVSLVFFHYELYVEW